MNAKRTFGIILTVLGIVGLIYAGYLGMVANGGDSWRMLAISAILGGIFFFTGISLVRNTQDVAK
jgi:uncharacterized membrane protein